MNPVPVAQFKDLLNQCYKIIHPDQIAFYGQEYSAVNSQSWTCFSELINMINVKSNQRQSIPNQCIFRMRFYIRPPKKTQKWKNRSISRVLNTDTNDIISVDENADDQRDEKPLLIPLNLRMSGGRCPDLMRKQLQLFFKEIGMKTYKFEWGEDYWQTSKEKQQLVEDTKTRKEDAEFVKKEIKVQEEEYKRFGPVRSRLNKLKFWKK